MLWAERIHNNMTGDSRSREIVEVRMVYKIHGSRWLWGVKEVAAPPTFKLSGWTWFMVVYSYSGHPPFHNGSVECSHIVLEKPFSTEEVDKRHANFTTSCFIFDGFSKESEWFRSFGSEVAFCVWKYGVLNSSENGVFKETNGVVGAI